MKRSCLVLLGVLACGSYVLAQAPSTPADAPATTPASAPAATQPAKIEKPGLNMQELKEKAEAGNVEAMVPYALTLMYGINGQSDVNAGMAWLKKAADKGNPAGMYCYGRALMTGIDGNKPDMKAALDWIVKAAKAGDPKACMMLFENLLGTATTSQQILTAVELGEAAVKAGSQEAMVKLAMVYVSGQVNGQPIKQDLAKGIALLEKASAAGNPVAPAYLGHIYSANLEGMTPDYAKAFAWFQKAAERGNPMGVYEMAVAYGMGRGVGKDTIKAVELSKKSAAMGYAPSMRQLEKIYRQGIGVEINIQEADMWKKKAEDTEKGIAPQSAHK